MCATKINYLLERVVVCVEIGRRHKEALSELRRPEMTKVNYAYCV